MHATLSGIGLQKSFGAKHVVRDVTFEMRQGEIMGLLGPNGAGKTTTFYMLTGIIKPTKGQVLLSGKDIGTWPLYRRARVGLSYLPQESSIFKKLTVYQNLSIIMEHVGLTRSAQKNAQMSYWKSLG